MRTNSLTRCRLPNCFLIFAAAAMVFGMEDGGCLQADEPKFQTLFNGKDLDGWKGTDSLWTVADGAIVGETMKDAPITANTFLVWQGGEVADFEFRCKVRFEGVNSGVQYRSTMVDEKGFALKGYQADLHPRADYMGMMYSEKTGRGIIATGGKRVVVPEEGKPKTVDQLVLGEKPDAAVWNELRIVAVGNRIIHQLNGHTVVDVTDNHPQAMKAGLLGLQLHRGGPMKAEFRDLQLRELETVEAARTLNELVAATKTVSPDEVVAKKPKEEVKKPAEADEVDPGIVALPGFVVEKVYSVPKDQGSWVSLCSDPQGRLYACDQGGAGLFRLTL